MSNAYRAVVQSGGGAAVGDATAADVLTGKTFSGAVGSGVSGTMPNNGAVSVNLTAGQSYTVPAGYHDGTGTVTALSDALVPAGSGAHFSSSKSEIVTLSTSAVNLVKGDAYVINASGYDTITIAGAGTLPTKIGTITSGVATEVSISANTPIDISSVDYVTLVGDGTSTFTLGVSNP